MFNNLDCVCVCGGLNNLKWVAAGNIFIDWGI